MKFLEWTYVTIEQPKAWSLVHILVLLLVFMGVLIAIKVAKKVNDKQGNLIVFSTGVFLIAIETYKQFFYTFIYYEGTYGWEYFPYQFCSVPMFLAVLLPFLKEGKVKKAGYYFLATQGAAAGLGILFFPDAIFSGNLSMLIHTSLWHGLQGIIGIFIGVWQKFGSSHKELYGGAIVCAVIFILALIFNIVGYHTLGPKGYKIHALQISPYYESTLYVFDDIIRYTNFTIGYISYYLTINLAGTIFWLGYKLSLRNQK